MPTAIHWTKFIFINLVFLILILYVYYSVSVSDIKKNWAEYRCNPMYMPLSDNMEEDFQYCIQNSQINFMGFLLQPLTFLTSSLYQNMAGFTDEINAVRGMFDKVRSFLGEIITNVFGVFFNLVVEFQRITISIKDLMGKTIGIMVTIMYMMDGSIKTMNSTWNGPSGQLVRSLGKCFHPETLIKLKNIEIPKKIKDVILGDVLENGSIIIGTMQLDNRKSSGNREDIYIIPGKGINNTDILVTGSHYIWHKLYKTWIPVYKHNEANFAELKFQTDILYCFITDNQRISIGDYIFWDWDDYVISNPLSYPRSYPNAYFPVKN